MNTPVISRRLSVVHARPGAALAAALTAVALTACSGGSDTSPDSAASSSASGDASSSSSASSGSSEPAPSSSTLQATEVDFSIELSDEELEAGKYTIEVSNEGDATHDLVVEDSSGADVAATEVIAPGGTGTVEVTLEPGEYAFYCSIGNHRGMGMELTVTVV